MNDEPLDRVKAALFGLNVVERLHKEFPDCEPRMPPLVTVIYAPGDHKIIGVFLDITRRAQPGDEKSFHHPVWDGRPLLQHRTCNFGLLAGEVQGMSADELAAKVRACVEAAVIAMRAVSLGDVDAVEVKA